MKSNFVLVFCIRDRHTIRFGTNYIFHEFTPGNATGRSGDVVFEPDEIYKQYSHEAAAYLSDDFDVSDIFKIHAGLRFSYFQELIKDSTSTELPEVISNNRIGGKDYFGLEPRLTFRYKINATSSLKGAYTQNYQYIHHIISHITCLIIS